MRINEQAKDSSRSNGVSETLHDFKQRFDLVFGKILRKHLAEIRSTTEDPYLDEYFEYLLETFAIHGKRIRPYVLMVMFEATGGRQTEYAMHYAAGVELFHTFCLIHDDIIDHSAVRHRQPTLHVEISRRMAEEGRVGDVSQIGEGQAMLVGDLIFYWSQQRLNSADGFSDTQRESANKVVKNMVEDVVVGQMVDVDAMSRQAVTSDIVARKTRLKTAGYTFTRPMQLGVALAGGSPDLAEWCSEFGEAIGEAFQMLDDLKDLTGDSAKGVQARYSDIREHQHTFFTQYVFDHGSPAQQRKLSGWLGSPITEPEVEQVSDLFESTGALAAGRRRISDLLARAEQSLRNVPGEVKVASQLSALIDMLKAQAELSK